MTWAHNKWNDGTVDGNSRVRKTDSFKGCFFQNSKHGIHAYYKMPKIKKRSDCLDISLKFIKSLEFYKNSC